MPKYTLLNGTHETRLDEVMETGQTVETDLDLIALMPDGRWELDTSADPPDFLDYGNPAVPTLNLHQRMEALLDGLVGQPFYDLFLNPQHGKLYAGSTHNWLDHPKLMAKYQAGTVDLIIDNSDGTFTVLDHTDFLRPGTTNIGTHVDDTTAVNGLAGTTSDRYAPNFTNKGSGGNVARQGNTTVSRTVNLTGDVETAPNHRTVYYGIYGDI